jgi:hypothetical protein
MILEDGTRRIFAVDERGRARRLSIQAILRRLLAEKQFQSWARGADNAQSVVL